MENKVFPTVRELVDQVEATQQENIEAAAQAMAECVMNGGIIQAWGGGHSLAGAMEIAHRAGGFIPTGFLYPKPFSCKSRARVLE